MSWAWTSPRPASSPPATELLEVRRRIRAPANKKGVTLEQAPREGQDVSYFGTMMVHMGDAAGMVSKARKPTTAHTIVPSLQDPVKPSRAAIVSSVFLSCSSGPGPGR